MKKESFFCKLLKNYQKCNNYTDLGIAVKVLILGKNRFPPLGESYLLHVQSAWGRIQTGKSKLHRWWYLPIITIKNEKYVLHRFIK